ncbi:MAG: adenylate/guanylate cyclase domain-containing protein [Leptospira sp.]|nr:adenylate/guanylate cyclase domain-containing protein [Leptospira sp.]
MAEKKSKISIIDIIALSVTLIGTIIVSYSAVASQSESFLVILSVGALLIFSAAFHVYKFLEKVSANKQYTGSILIGYLVAILIFTLANIFTPLTGLEESSISWRFTLLNPGAAVSEKETEEGKIEYEKFTPPERARKDIQIIGITNNSLEKLQGTWPLPWQYYANIIKNFKDTENNVLMFDIFFVDYKAGQMDVMKNALSQNRSVLFDYPMETSAKSKELVLNLDERLRILNRYKLENVTDPDNVGVSWVKFAVPPIEQIAENAAGLGFANIKKDDTGMNRKMPLVAKIFPHGLNNPPEYYPSIDLMIVCRYFGVDVSKDTEVVMGKYVKIKNIPKRQISRMNLKLSPPRLESLDVMHTPNEKREIEIPIDYEGQMEINFVGGRYSYRAHEIFEASTEWNAETVGQFNNTVFLIAMYYATGRGASKDSHLSPFGEISGIEHHAHAINTILNQDFLHSLPNWIDLLIYVAIGILIGFVQPRIRTWLGFIMIIVIAIFYTAITLINFSQFNLINIFPTVLIEQLVIFVGIIGFKILTEEANVKYIRSTFSNFVSTDVVDFLLAHPENLKLGGEKRDITIFFSDIRGFTTISEALGPEELVKLLNEYLTEMSNIIMNYKGAIDKYMGDAIMAYWGAPFPLEDHAYYACIAALSQMQQLAVLQDQWRERKVPVIDIGIGLNSGPAVVGLMGSAFKKEWTNMGDTINLGSRLEGSNKTYGTNIIISEYVYERVKDRVYSRELDLVQVKGKTQPVRIYELIGLINDADMERLRKPLAIT